MKHTKEPWHAYERDLISDGTKIVAQISGDTIREVKANRERIILCVNKCAGLTNEALEADLLHWAISMWSATFDIHNNGKELRVWEES